MVHDLDHICSAVTAAMSRLPNREHRPKPSHEQQRKRNKSRSARTTARPSHVGERCHGRQGAGWFVEPPGFLAAILDWDVFLARLAMCFRAKASGTSQKQLSDSREREHGNKNPSGEYKKEIYKYTIH